MSDAFWYRPGELSGRIPMPEDWNGAPSGDNHVWCVGNAQPGWTGRFVPGDGAYVEQQAEYGATRKYIMRYRLRGPSSPLPAGWHWEVYANRAGAAGEVWSRKVPVDVQLENHYLEVPTAGLAGIIHLRFGLRLVGPGGALPAELELPGFLIASVVVDDSAFWQSVCNAIPERAERNVALDSVIRFDVADPYELGVNLSSTTITYNDPQGLQWIYLYGSAELGWTVETEQLPGLVRFTLTPPQPMPPAAEIGIYIVSGSYPTGVSGGYSFATQDSIAPALVSAQARGQKTIRVEYSESMDSIVLTPTIYEVRAVTTPAVPVQVVAADWGAESGVDLTLDIAASPGRRYEITVTGAKDESGNLIAAPNNVAEFVGVGAAAPPGRRFQLWDMIPELNREEDATGDLRALTTIFQEVIDLLLADVDRWTDILDVDLADERYLDHMLIQLGNPFTFELSAEDKRRLIRVLVAMYRQKGTTPGIVNTIRFFLGLEVTVNVLGARKNVWNLGEDRLGKTTRTGPDTSRGLYAFEVVSTIVLGDVTRERIRAIVEYMKAAHEHFVRIREPLLSPPVFHVQLGRSRLGGPSSEWRLH